jgi:hypothetical protein
MAMISVAISSIGFGDDKDPVQRPDDSPAA